MMKRARKVLYESQLGWTITSAVIGSGIGLFFAMLYERAR